jgi:hypothetical protein
VGSVNLDTLGLVVPVVPVAREATVEAFAMAGAQEWLGLWAVHRQRPRVRPGLVPMVAMRSEEVVVSVPYLGALRRMFGIQEGSSTQVEFRDHLKTELADLEINLKASPELASLIDLAKFRADLDKNLSELPYASMFADARLVRFRCMLSRSIAGVNPQSAAAAARCKVISLVMSTELSDLDRADAKALDGVVASLSKDNSLEESAYDFMRRSWNNDASRAIEQMKTFQTIRVAARMATFFFAVTYVVGSLLKTSGNIFGYIGASDASILIAKEVVTSLGNLVSSPPLWCAFLGFVGAVFSMLLQQTTSPPGHWSTVRVYGRQVRLWLGAVVGLLVAMLGPTLLGQASGGVPDWGRLFALAVAFGFSQDRFVSKVQTFAS